MPNIEEIYNEYKNGKGVYELAKEQNIHPQTLYRKFKRNGLLLLDKRSNYVKYSNNEVRKWHSEHIEGKSINKISNEKGMDPSTIYNRFKKLNLPYTKYKNQSKIEPFIKSIHSQYMQGKPVSELAKEFNCTSESINRYFRKYQLKRTSRAFEVNENFFDNIDTEIKSYLLGFFVADGCVYDKTRMGVLIQAGDRYILELFKKFVCPGQTINFRVQKKKKNQVLIRWSSKEMVQSLSDLGVRPRKSYEELVTMNHIPEALKRDFIRGVIDGDGCTSKGIVITNSSTYLLKGIQDWFSTLGIDSKINERGNCFDLVCWGAEDRDLIVKVLKHNAKAYLRRKWK